jgi:probable rRNA maturation factor
METAAEKASADPAFANKASTDNPPMTPELLEEPGEEPKRSRAARAANKNRGPAACDAAPNPAPDLERKANYAVDVTFVSDEEIHTLNRDYRKKNKPTDVLSFSQWEGEMASDMAFGGFASVEALALGDLIISVETAQRQAAELGHSLEREIEFLAVHGALHLLGYDHIRDSDRRVMWQQQEAIVEELRIKNGE